MSKEKKQIKADIETVKKLYYKSQLEDAELHCCAKGNSGEYFVINFTGINANGVVSQPVNKKHEVELLAASKSMAKLILQMEKFI